ncbi:3-dehydroquinate synthase [Teredinibacter purpureus]|uniref:3-dehydroquinate synthase n=1 Tax=Teredinibacter purpureus TaxID=2731756 RepID=UPI000ADBFF0F|nr:3-dehydroquinate synthase [Teredinibacter purpureus]
MRGSHPHSGHSSALQSLTRYSAIVALIILLIVGSHFLLEESLNALLESVTTLEHGVLASGLIFLGLTFDVVLPIPSSVLSIWAVISQGFITGFLVIWAGMCAGCILGYGLGASANKTLLRRFFAKHDIDAAHLAAQRYGSSALLFTRAIPVLAEASVVTAGLTKMPLRTFLPITMLSNAGIAFAYASVGSWANHYASFGLAFAASISLPIVALASYRFVQWLTAPKAQKTSHIEQTENQLNPRFNIDFSYPLCFTRHAFQPANSTLIKQLCRGKSTGATVKVQFFIDQGVLDKQPLLDAQIRQYCAVHNIDWHNTLHTVPASEAAKTHTQIERMHSLMLEAELDRQSYVIAIGGGGVLDAVGYAAATFHRGIRLIRMPTTVLAQNDAGVGVKNGINSVGIKNLLGCFAVPHAIINDAVFLDSLADRDFRSGFAEAIKVALIRDANFYHWIYANREALVQRESKASAHLIKRCAELHLNQICNGGDPFEMGSARPLDYGHWSAHKLESLTSHALSHGEAVAIGMALDALYAVEVGLLEQDKAEHIIFLIRSLGFDVWHPSLHWNTEQGESALLKGLEEFRQHLGGQLCITLLTGFGKTLEANHIDQQALLRARNKLQNFFQASAKTVDNSAA